MDTPPVTVKKILVNSSTKKSSLTPCRRMGLCRPSTGSLKKSLHVRTLSTPTLKPSVSTEISESVSVSVSVNSPLSCEERLLEEPLKTSNSLNKSVVPRVRRCLTASSLTPSPLGVKRVLSTTEMKDCNDDNGNLNPTSEIKENHADNSSKYDKKRRLSFKSTQKHTKESSLTENEHSRPVSPAASSENFGDAVAGDNIEEVTSEMIKQLASSVKEKKIRLEQLKVQEVYAKKHNLADLRAQTAKWREAGREALRHSLSLAKQAGYCVTLKQLMVHHAFPIHLMGYNSEDDEFD